MSFHCLYLFLAVAGIHIWEYHSMSMTDLYRMTNKVYYECQKKSKVSQVFVYSFFVIFIS